MSVKDVIALTKMKTGKNGKIVSILGGSAAFRRLEALGLRIGKKITKKSSGFLWGPVTVQVGGAQIGIGYGMAAKVMIEVDK